jgi:hypothetical protein
MEKHSEANSPSQLFELALARFGRERWLALGGTFVAGILVHFSLLSYQVTNADGICNSVYKLGTTSEMRLGRWAIHFVEIARHGLVLPVMSVLVSLLMLSFTALVLRELLGLRSPLHILLMAGLLASYPQVASTLIYFYCSDAYFLSLFLSVLGVFLTAKGNRWVSIIPGAACLVVSMGLYQSYVGVSIALCFLIVLQDLLKDTLSLGQVFRRAGRLMAMIVLGGAGYFVSMKIALRMAGVIAAHYRGIDQIGHFNLSQLPSHASRSLYEFFAFYLTDDFLKNSWWGLNRVYFVLMLIGAFVSLSLVLQKRPWHDRTRLGLLLLCVPMFPIAHEAIVFLAPQTRAGILMLPQMVLPFLLLLAFCEQLRLNRRGAVLQWGAVALCLLLCFQYALLSNAVYLRMDLDTQRTEAAALQGLTMLEHHPDFGPDKKIAFVGNPLSNEYSPRAYQQVAWAVLGTTAQWGVIPWKDVDFSQAVWESFLRIHFGVKLNRCTKNELTTLLGTQAFKAMRSFPARECVQEINNILVIKFSDFE